MLNPFLMNTPLHKSRLELKAKVNAKVDVCIFLANNFFARPGINFPLPAVTFDLVGTVAGQAHYTSNFSGWKIRFNMDLLLENSSNMINDTVPHEVAHLITFALYGVGVKAHGPEWQRITKELGGSGERCHNYNVVPAKKTRKFMYLCDCGNNHIIGLNIHRKMQNGSQRFCVDCKSTITFLEEIINEL